MHENMPDLAVNESNGFLYIEQQNIADGDQSIQVHPDQVDILIKWLNRAKKETMKSEND